MASSRHQVGAVGEAGFVYQATQRGLKVAKPLGDKESYDFIIDNRRQCFRVQVKTTSVLCSRTSYHVTAGRGAMQKTCYRKDEIDFLVIHILPEGTWFILPWEALGGRIGLNVPSVRRGNWGQFAPYFERWDLLAGEAGEEDSDGALRKSPQSELVQASEEPGMAM